ncbi:MAG: DUF4290 domain-containing protein [Dysgonamonadaceae bacterium]|jgi:hypothetical protein|nr:DUF4290 domain-containing protein [Dysgonamonadaceae bacterium]
MEYNTQLKRLILPEYGRNIQNMVDHCVTVADRDERKRCAQSVITIMGNMFPHLRDVNDFKHILWDHLAIMSDFKLDIDYPYEIVRKEDLHSQPGHLDYSRPTMQYRHYGKIIEKMIAIATDMPEGAEREQLIRLLVSQMKRSYVQWNKEVDDAKIFHDLAELSGQKILLDTEKYSIPEAKVTNVSKSKLKNIKGRRK